MENFNSMLETGVVKKGAWCDNVIYEVTTDVNSLDIKINAADVTIEHGNIFAIESNLENLSVFVKGGVLMIVDEAIYTLSFGKKVLKLCIPFEKVFDVVDIVTGAGIIMADSLSANSMKLNMGAGKSQFGCLNAASNIDINSGTGEMTISSGRLSNLTLAMGTGKLDLTATLSGENDLKLGIGKTSLTLIGSRDEYVLDVTKGIGKITINEKNASDFGGKVNAQKYVKIRGGIGATNVSFRAG